MKKICTYLLIIVNIIFVSLCLLIGGLFAFFNNLAIMACINSPSLNTGIVNCTSPSSIHGFWATILFEFIILYFAIVYIFSLKASINFLTQKILTIKGLIVILLGIFSTISVFYFKL